MFKSFIKNRSNFHNIQLYANGGDDKPVVVYPISEYNLEGIKFLIKNCEDNDFPNNNVTYATANTSLWLGDFLDKYYDKIAYVATVPMFDILKVEGGEIVSKNYRVQTDELNEDELDDFFKEGKWRKFVLYNIKKVVNLDNMKVTYQIRYADITEKYEVRDNKIKSIIGDDNLTKFLEI